MRTPRPIGHRYRQARKAILQASAEEYGSPRCHWCGHLGADAANHVDMRSHNPARDVADPSNLAPIHGVAGCPTCGRRCNNDHSTYMRRMAARQAARLSRQSRDW